MSLDRAQRRALERAQRKNSASTAVAAPVLFSGAVPLWLALLIALPLVAVPLYFVYMPPGFLVPGGYGQILINEFQKFVAELVCLALVLMGAGVLLVRRNLWPRWPRLIVWPALLYLVAVSFSLLQAQDFGRGLLNGLEVSLLPVLFFLLVAGLRWSQSRALLVVGLMLAAGAVVSVIGICQQFEVWGFALLLPHVGAGSLLFFQNLAGEYLILLIPLALVLSFMPIHWSLRAAAAVLSLLLLTHLAMTLARGAWVGLFGGLVFSLTLAALGIYQARKKITAAAAAEQGTVPVAPSYKKLKYAAGLLLLVLLGLGIWLGTGAKGSDSVYAKELRSISLSNTTGRLQIWTDSLQLLEDHWLTGVGPGNYRIAIPAYLDEIPSLPYLFSWGESNGQLMYPFRTHNDYLQHWIELGLFGLLGLLWLFVSVTWISTRGIGAAVVHQEIGRALLILGCFAAFSAWCVSMLFEFPIRMPSTLVLGWFSAGLAVALSLGQQGVSWAPIRPGLNRSAGAGLALLVVVCFWAAHLQFWSDIYEHQASVAWNDKNLLQGYEWQQKATAYLPWKESAATKARMELGLEKYDAALRTTQDILQRNPYLLPALWAQGVAAGNLGQDELSRAAFRKIVETYPFLAETEKYRKFAGLPPAEKE